MGYTIQPTICRAPAQYASDREIVITFSILGAAITTAVVVALIGWGWQGLLNISMPTLLITVMTAGRALLPR